MGYNELGSFQCPYKESFWLMESLREWWSGVVSIPGATWIIYPSLLIVLILIAYYVLHAIRNLAIGGSVATDDHLGSFRKMRDEGMLDSEEYKKLAGLVPLPETKTKVGEEVTFKESGPDVLAAAAKDVIRKAALKQANDSAEENDESNSEQEDDQSTES